MTKKNFKPILLKDAIGAYLLQDQKQQVVIWRNFGRIPNIKKGIKMPCVKKGQGLLNFPFILAMLFIAIVLLYAFSGLFGGLFSMVLGASYSGMIKYLLIFGIPFMLIFGLVLWFFSAMRG